jgi:hypothetical protein
MPDSPGEWILVVAILVTLGDVARREWVRGDKRVVLFVIVVLTVVMFAFSDISQRMPATAKAIFAFLLMVFAADQFNRAYGPRAHGHSGWTIRLGRRDLPKVTRAYWFLRLGQLARLVVPAVVGATAIASWQWLQGESDVFLGLSAPDWLTLLGLAMGLWLAALPHMRLRVAPLTNWDLMLFGLLCVVASVLFLVQQYIVRTFPTLIDAPLWRDMAQWTRRNPPGSVNGWALAVFGVGLTLISLAETTRKWRPSDVIPDPGAQSSEAPVAPQSRSLTPRGRQKPPRQRKSTNRRKRR